MKKFIVRVFIVGIMIFSSGCGYRPTSYYAQHEIKGSVFVHIKIDINNATNSVLIKDAVNEMVISQFGASLIHDKTLATTIVNVSLGKVSFKTLQDDNMGYAKLYRTTVSINLDYFHPKEKFSARKSITVSGSYDYSVDSDSLITDAKKQESVKIAAKKALSEIFSKIAVETFDDKYDNNQTKARFKTIKPIKHTKSKSFFFFN